MKIALVYPQSEGNKFVNSYPPLGIGYISSILEKNGHKTKIFDFALHKDWELEKQLDKLFDFNPDLIGISIMTINATGGFKLAKKIKQKSDIKIIFGGPHATMHPEECSNYGDYVCVGEGEHLALELAEGKNPKRIEGLYINKNNFEKRDLIQNLDSLPFPDRNKYELKKYPTPELPLITSRGCPYSCTYCYKGLFGRKYRPRSAENVIKELKYLENNFHPDKYWFVDDLFVFDKKRVLEICKKIIDEKLNIQFKCLSRVDTIDKDIIKSLSEAGCYRIEFGVESGDSKQMKKVKGITKKQVIRAVNFCNKFNINTKGYFMLALPGDTKKTMEKTINFASSAGFDTVQFSITTPFPGTKLYETAKEKKDFDYRKAHYRQGDEILANLSNVSDDIIKHFYEKGQYVRFKTFLKSKNIKFLAPLFKYKKIREFAKSFYSKFLLKIF